MRLAALVIVFGAAACDRGAKPTKPLPPGPYTVHYDCFHSDEPFGKGSQYRNQAFDLGARTYTSQSYERSGDVPPPDKPEPPPPPPQTRPLSGDRVTAINAAVEKVLSGGPYKPEYPVPEGTPCTLVITGQGNKEVFKIEKAAAEETDAVSDLVRTLVP